MAQNRSWPVTGLGNKGPLKVLDGAKLILDDHGNNLNSFSLDSFRSFRGPLLYKPVTGQELSFAVSYSTSSLVTKILVPRLIQKIIAVLKNSCFLSMCSMFECILFVKYSQSARKGIAAYSIHHSTVGFKVFQSRSNNLQNKISTANDQTGFSLRS